MHESIRELHVPSFEPAALCFVKGCSTDRPTLDFIIDNCIHNIQACHSVVVVLPIIINS